KTVANFTNHSYFNLSSQRKIFGHQLSLAASEILQTDEGYIPTGRKIHTGGLSFSGQFIEEKIKGDGNALEGINTYYILKSESHKPAGVLWEKSSGRRMEVFTSYPGILLYTGDFLLGNETGSQGYNYEPFDGLCLECQHYPDAPNQP